MRHFGITVDVDADPARVWAVMRDVERWSDWTASVTRIRRLGGGPLAVGSRALVRQPKLPPALWTVVSLDEGRAFTWVSRAPGLFAVFGSHSVEPRGVGARVSLRLEYRGLLGGLLARLTRDLNDRYLAMEAAGLKHRSERDAAACAGA